MPGPKQQRTDAYLESKGFKGGQLGDDFKKLSAEEQQKLIDEFTAQDTEGNKSSEVKGIGGAAAIRAIQSDSSNKPAEAAQPAQPAVDPQFEAAVQQLAIKNNITEDQARKILNDQKNSKGIPGAADLLRNKQ